MRKIEQERITKETKIKLSLDLDGSGINKIDTGCGFFDHMLQLFSSHGGFDLQVSCQGDTNVDYHHTVEDVGIVLGTAFEQVLGEKKGIMRYGSFILPMDEALILTAIDISGRSNLIFNVQIPSRKVGDFDSELVKEFFAAFVRSMKITLHIKQLAGENSHHIIEGIFKSFARALSEATTVDKKNIDKIPSTKGVL